MAPSPVSSPAAAEATDAGVSLSWSRLCEPAIMLAQNHPLSMLLNDSLKASLLTVDVLIHRSF